MISLPPVNLAFDDVYSGVEHMLLKSPALRKLPPQELRWHLMWYWNRGTMSWVRKPEGKYTGLCLIKLIRDLKDMDQWYVHAYNGQILFIEETVSDGPDTWRSLFDQLYEIWGPRAFVVWDRRDRTSKCPRIYSWGQYLRILKRLTHGYEPS